MLQGIYFVGDEIESPKDIYELKISLMHGDGDAYTSIKLYFERYEEHQLTSTLDLLREMKHKDSTSGRTRQYGSIQGFEELFYEEWEWDSTSHYNYYAGYRGHSLTYYNDEGRQYKVIETLTQI